MLSDTVQPSISGAGEAARERIRPTVEEEPFDTEEIIRLIIESVLPLLAPILVSRRKKQPDGTVRTIDDSVGNLAEQMGVSRSFIRGKLGLGDRRKTDTGKKKRRITDRSK